MARLKLVPTLLAIALVEIVILVCALIPYSTEAIPQWNVVVTDKAGNLLANAPVHQAASFSGLSRRWSESRFTDQHGRVSFTARTVRASFMKRLFLRAAQKQSTFPYGPLVAAWVCYQGQYAISQPGQVPDTAGLVRLTTEPRGCRPD